VVALAVVLTACGSGGGGRRGHGSGGISGGDSGSVGRDDDDDIDIDGDDLDDFDTGLDTADPDPTDPSGSPGAVELSAILPDLPALSGTRFTVGGVTGDQATVCQDYPEVCGTETDQAMAAFKNDAEDEFATFQVLAFGSETDASAALDGAAGMFGAEDGYAERERDTLGDGSVSYDVAEGGEQEGQVTIVQRGPYMGAVAYSAHDATLLTSWELSDAMALMFDERMAQAESGSEPTATVAL
jgi:hypothetical protein